MDMLGGGLGQPTGGFPAPVVRAVLGDAPVTTKRPGEDLPPLDLEATRAGLGEGISDDDLYSSLMYPQVWKEFAAFKESFGDVSVLPTPAYFYGLAPDEEISITIEAGKTLILNSSTSASRTNRGGGVSTLNSTASPAPCWWTINRSRAKSGAASKSTPRTRAKSAPRFRA